MEFVWKRMKSSASLVCSCSKAQTLPRPSQTLATLVPGRDFSKSAVLHVMTQYLSGALQGGQVFWLTVSEGFHSHSREGKIAEGTSSMVAGVNVSSSLFMLRCLRSRENRLKYWQVRPAPSA